MLIWFVLFFIILAISLVLAYQSMSDYHEAPKNWGVVYSLFLVGRPQNLTKDVWQKLYLAALSKGFILSLERLFKGSKKALVIFGPSLVLNPLTADLGLLELEDYSQKLPSDIAHLAAWEVGVKASHPKPLILPHISQFIPKLEDTEEFRWQLVLQPVKKDLNYSFQTKIRGLVISSDTRRVKELREELVKIGKDQGLAMLPQAYTSLQIAKFYQQRSAPSASLMNFSAKEKPLILEPKEITSFLSD